MREQYHFAKHVYERALDNTFVYRITYFRIGDPLLSDSQTPPVEIKTPPVEIKTPPVEIKTPPVEIKTPPVGI